MQVCACVRGRNPPILWGTLSYMRFTSAGLYLYQTSVTDIVTMATAGEDH